MKKKKKKKARGNFCEQKFPLVLPFKKLRKCIGKDFCGFVLNERFMYPCGVPPLLDGKGIGRAAATTSHPPFTKVFLKMGCGG
ncbi:MAG: hypothetical protein IJY66_07535, partial [Clostridia bacterium]|nr:hypothetical protein [Clostridia bacterium]